MAVAQQKNLGNFTYVDNGGTSFNKRGELDAVRNAVDGSTAAGANPAWGRESRRHRVRKIVYQDAVTLRTKTCIMYTQAADAAITLGTSALTFLVEGQATGVLYIAVARIDEKQPSTRTPTNLIDHP